MDPPFSSFLNNSSADARLYTNMHILQYQNISSCFLISKKITGKKVLRYILLNNMDRRQDVAHCFWRTRESIGIRWCHRMMSLRFWEIGIVGLCI